MTRTHRQRLALATLLIATALLYLLGLSRSGWANAYYAAAAQAASQSWKAFLFGSFDSASFITVDKTPASLWLMGLSVRVFGLSSFTLLLPQALCGVGSVALLYATVRRWSGAVAGLIAGAVLALTPVAVLMFRFNNPDALLVLLLVAGAYGVTRAVQSGQTRWLVFAGSAVGFAFLTKMLQAFLVLPAFGLAYLIAGPPRLGKRIGQLAIALVAMVVSAGWWVALVELWPAASRPYVGGSQNNSILELTLGYNGLGRLTGEEVGSVGGAGRRLGEVGLLRMFNDSYGGQASWLLPAALILLAVGFFATARRGRTDALRAGFVLWGGWLLSTALVFSFMQGIIHEYYTVALAPAIGALVGGGGVLLWRVRRLMWARVAGGVAVAATGWWAHVLLGRSPDFVPWLRWTVLLSALVLGAALVASRMTPRWTQRVVALGGLVVALAGPTAFALQTAASAHSGSIVTAGPASANGGFRGGPGGGGGLMPGGQRPGGQQQGGQMQGGAAPGAGRTQAQGGAAQGGMGAGARGAGGMGGLLNATTPSAELKAALEQDAERYTWVVATIGANNAAGYQLALQRPVMAIGGFNGSDDAPSLEQFQRWVAEGKVHYFLDGGGFQANGGSQVPAQIAAWVAATFPTETVGGVTLYDLSAGAK